VLRSVVSLALLAFVLAGCSGDSKPTAGEKPSEQSTQSQASKAKGICPVTLPNGDTPPGEKPSSGDHGNGKIWTGLWPYGVIVAAPEFVEPDDSIRMKFFWFADGVEGSLSIRGRRLDESSPPVRATISSASPETGFSGDAFWASAIIFPTEGCWEITGKVGGASLTFVNLVIKPVT